MANFPETRISLILRLRESEDVQAWREFAEIYAPALYGLALRKGLQAADAEDVTQDILFGVARAIERFEPQGKFNSASKASEKTKHAAFRTWLSRIARNLIADFFRRKMKQPATQSHDSWLPEDPQGTESASTLEAEFAQEYRRAVFRLAAKRVRSRVSEKSWAAFERTAVQGEPMEQVAKNLELAKGTLYVARSRVMKMLRIEVQQLEKEHGERDIQFAQPLSHDDAPHGVHDTETRDDG